MRILAVEYTLAQLGRDLRVARKRRRLAIQDVAERVGVSRKTLERMEAGHPGVRLETLAAAMMVFGELDRLRELMSPERDETGWMLEESRLPKRIRRQDASSPPSSSPADSDDSNSGPVGF